MKSIVEDFAQIRACLAAVEIKKREEEIRQQAENLLRMIECAHDQAIYESSLGFIAPQDDPA